MEKKKISRLKKEGQARVKTYVADGLGRVAAIRKMFAEWKDAPGCDVVLWFPALHSVVEKSNYQTVAGLSRLIDCMNKQAYDSIAALLLMGQISDKYNRKVWILMGRAAKYVPDYVDRHSPQRFYPYTALALEAHMRTGSPKAWNTIECGFGIRDQSWFETHSTAYKSIINEFGEAALPSCFV